MVGAVATAAEECSFAPRMLLNPQFVAQCCQRDGHLLMLVMHELQHIILGHTRLFPRVTIAHNLAFDAIINAIYFNLLPYNGVCWHYWLDPRKNLTVWLLIKPLPT